jgi:hypothetical protein
VCENCGVQLVAGACLARGYTRHRYDTHQCRVTTLRTLSDEMRQGEGVFVLYRQTGSWPAASSWSDAQGASSYRYQKGLHSYPARRTGMCACVCARMSCVPFTYTYICSYTLTNTFTYTRMHAQTAWILFPHEDAGPPQNDQHAGSRGHHLQLPDAQTRKRERQQHRRAQCDVFFLHSQQLPRDAPQNVL